MYILGISAFYHDSAAALVKDGVVLFAAQEERFSRIKNDSNFPTKSIQFLLKEAGIDACEIDSVIFYDKPWLKLERIMDSVIRFVPKTLVTFLTSMPIWLSKKFNMRGLIKKELLNCDGGFEKQDILFSEHHFSHAASSFYTSPFEDSCSVVIDGVGEWSTLSIFDFNADGHHLLEEMHYPDSVGLLYSACTYYCGFEVNSGEYKLMGLAPYGDLQSDETKRFKDKIFENLVTLNSDGSIRLNLKYFSFHLGEKMICESEFEKLFKLSRRIPEEDISQSYCNFALAAQLSVEEILIKVIRYARSISKSKNLCLSGGVALNCVANSKINSLKIFDNIWIHPAAGDAGGSVGAALGYYYSNHHYVTNQTEFSPYLGPSFSDQEITYSINKYNMKYEKLSNSELFKTISQEIFNGKIIGWFQDRMEWGPRALGNRSILADPTKIEMQKNLNLKIKFREGFRPFAPVVMEEHSSEFFKDCHFSPFMQFTFEVNNSYNNGFKSVSFFKRLCGIESPVAAVTHNDLSARVQTVNQNQNHKMYKLLEKFKEVSGVPILINTSFNVRGEPIVCSPEDAIDCFIKTDIDILVLDNFVVQKPQV